jgi:predicted metal-dependent peptidase
MDAQLLKVTKARTRLLIEQPFFGTLCLRLEISKRTDMPTMATDGRYIFYNPDFVEKLSHPELMGVFAHEVLHCALSHHTRRGDRHPVVWNIAADFVINPILKDAGMQLPAGCLYDQKYAGKSAEEVYADLMQNAKYIKISSGSGEGVPESEGGCGQVLDAPGENGGKASQEDRCNTGGHSGQEGRQAAGVAGPAG